MTDKPVLKGYVRPDLLQGFKDAAKRHNRSVSGELEYLVICYLHYLERRSQNNGIESFGGFNESFEHFPGDAS